MVLYFTALVEKTLLKVVVSPGPCGCVGGSLFCKLNVTGSISGQGTCLGCRFGPQLGLVQDVTDLMFLSSIHVSLPLSFPFPLSRINKRKKNLSHH